MICENGDLNVNSRLQLLLLLLNRRESCPRFYHTKNRLDPAFFPLDGNVSFPEQVSHRDHEVALLGLYMCRVVLCDDMYARSHSMVWRDCRKRDEAFMIGTVVKEEWTKTPTDSEIMSRIGCQWVIMPIIFMELIIISDSDPVT